MNRGGGDDVLELLHGAAAAPASSVSKIGRNVAQAQRAISRSTPWRAAPAFSGPWVNIGAPYAVAAYRKDANGVVRIKGVVKGGLSGSTIFTLPAGFRPSEEHVFATYTDTGAGRFDVLASGVVKHVAGGTGLVSIDCSFVAEQ